MKIKSDLLVEDKNAWENKRLHHLKEHYFELDKKINIVSADFTELAKRIEFLRVSIADCESRLNKLEGDLRRHTRAGYVRARLLASRVCIIFGLGLSFFSFLLITQDNTLLSFLGCVLLGLFGLAIAEFGLQHSEGDWDK